MITSRLPGNRKLVNPTALLRATRAQQLNGIYGGWAAPIWRAARSTVWLPGAGTAEISRLPVRNWFAGGVPASACWEVILTADEEAQLAAAHLEGVASGLHRRTMQRSVADPAA